MQGRHKELVVLLDADDCIYNDNYYYILLSIVAKYGQKIFLLSYQGIEKSQHESFVAEIIAMIESMVIYSEDNLTFSIKKQKKILDLEKEIMTRFDWDKKELNKLFNKINKYKKLNALKDTAINEEIFKNVIDLYKLGDLGKKIHKAILLAANQNLFASIVLRMHTENFNHLTVMSISNRQVELDDQHNAKQNRTGLFFRDIRYICEIFNELLLNEQEKKQCGYNDFTMKKVYGEAAHVWDENKFTVYLSILNEIGLLFKHQEVVVAAYDDKIKILAKNIRKFIYDLYLIPRRMSLEFHYYNGEFIQDKKFFLIEELNDAMEFAILLKANNTSLHKMINAGYVIVMYGEGRAGHDYPELIKMIAKISISQEELSLESIAYHFANKDESLFEAGTTLVINDENELNIREIRKILAYIIRHRQEQSDHDQPEKKLNRFSIFDRSYQSLSHYPSTDTTPRTEEDNSSPRSEEDKSTPVSSQHSKQSSSVESNRSSMASVIIVPSDVVSADESDEASVRNTDSEDVKDTGVSGGGMDKSSHEGLDQDKDSGSGCCKCTLM